MIIFLACFACLLAHTQKVFRTNVSLPDIIDYNWLAGFFSGDGCFSFFFVCLLSYAIKTEGGFARTRHKSCVTGFSIKLRILITQHSNDKVLKDKIVNTLKSGYILFRKAVVLAISAFKDISTFIIPLFKNFQLKECILRQHASSFWGFLLSCLFS